MSRIEERGRGMMGEGEMDRGWDRCYEDALVSPDAAKVDSTIGPARPEGKLDDILYEMRVLKRKNENSLRMPAPCCSSR